MTGYGGVPQGPENKKRENNPMQSRIGPRLAAFLPRWFRGTTIKGTTIKMVRRHFPKPNLVRL